jgi:hypothetical protein
MSWNPNEKPLSKRELQEIVDAERSRRDFESGMNQASSAVGDLIGMGLVGIHSNPKFAKYNYLMGGICALVSFVLLVDNNLGWFWKILLPLLAGLFGWALGLLALFTASAGAVIWGIIKVLDHFEAF